MILRTETYACIGIPGATRWQIGKCLACSGGCMDTYVAVFTLKITQHLLVSIA